MILDKTTTQLHEAVKNQYAKTFGEKLQKALKDNGTFKTKKDFANAINVSPNTVGAYLNGTMFPTLTTAITIADVLNVSLDDLLGRTEDYTKIPNNATLGDYVRILLEMESQDIIDIKVHNSEIDNFKLTFRSPQLIEFFKDYKNFCEMASGQNERKQRLYQNWLNMTLEQLDANRDLKSTNKSDL